MHVTHMQGHMSSRYLVCGDRTVQFLLSGRGVPVEIHTFAEATDVV